MMARNWRVVAFLSALLLLPPLAWADDVDSAPAPERSQWIWTPAHEPGEVPPEVCHFRKSLTIPEPAEGLIEITADDSFELFVNGRKVGEGGNWRTLYEFDIQPYLIRGRNVVAVRVENKEPGDAALVARIVVKSRGSTHQAFVSDSSWKTRLKVSPRWKSISLDSRQWVPARELGALGNTLPWGNETRRASGRGRFQLVRGFEISRMVDAAETGSLIAMTFDEFGHIIASRENGPLLILADSDDDGRFDHVAPYCEQVTNCQGLLALNGDLFVVGDGPQGWALYRLSDTDRNARIDQVKPLIEFEGKTGEHGPHGIALGPDGLLYVMVGNHCRTKRTPAQASPLQDAYEGDLLQPRYEDPGGHAVGVEAPGGTVIRTDVEGKTLERFTGGLRNAYDLAFNRQGELFTFDSDMEANLGFPWYRPTRIYHLIGGGDYGWRSGWAKWPDYFLDGLSAAGFLGKGSPTGLVFYDHFRFPIRYHDSMFACDWASGRIYAVRLEPAGGSYRATASVFLEGRPLNATDIEVGPDGRLYFCTGGRGTEGGIYAIGWRGKVPPEVSDLGEGVTRALRQPQLHSAWSRQQIAEIQRDAGNTWGAALRRVATDRAAGVPERLRALDLLQLFGPEPDREVVLRVSRSDQPELRQKAAYLMGLTSNDRFADRLIGLLEDPDPHVRRQACASLAAGKYQPPAEMLLDRLADREHFVTFAARRALGHLDRERWQQPVLSDRRIRVFLHGSVALLSTDPGEATARRILSRCEKMLKGDVDDPQYPRGFISDYDFTELLRVVQLAIVQAKIEPEKVTTLRETLSREYPTKDAILNRELSRILAHLQDPDLSGRLVDQLKAPQPRVEKLHLASLAPFLKVGWTTEQKLELAAFWEQARQDQQGASYRLFLDRVARDFFRDADPEEQRLLISRGANWPGSALAVLASLPREVSDELLADVIALDRQLQPDEGDDADRLRTGIVAVLARSGKPEAMAHLRSIFESDPQRRSIVAMGLAQQPEGENWPLLIRALPILEGAPAQEVVNKLATVDRQPEDPEAVRQLILLMLRMKSQGLPTAIKLLENWTGERAHRPDDTWQQAVARWQQWLAEAHPDLPPAVEPEENNSSKWTFEELLRFLESEQGEGGDPGRGAVVFEQAQCAKCHRFGSRGEAMGPDLTTISRRFHRREILQSIMFPSHVISSQFASRSVITRSGLTHTGIAVEGDAEWTVLTAEGRKITIAADEVDEVVPSKQSAMPENLLNPLTLEAIADLFAYLSAEPRANITSRRREGLQ